MKYVHILSFRIDMLNSTIPSFLEIRSKLDTKFMPYAEYVNIRNNLKIVCDQHRYENYRILLIEHMILTLEDDEEIPNDKTSFVDFFKNS